VDFVLIWFLLVWEGESGLQYSLLKGIFIRKVYKCRVW